MGVDSHRDSLHEQLSHLPQHHHGSHQKEDAGYEGGEGQRLRPRGRLRGAVQSCQAEGVQGRGRGGRADDSERAKKVFQSKADEDERRITGLEKELKEAREKAEAADAHYDEVAKKLATCESELEKAEERADVGETKILELEEELRVVANNLKSLEVAEEKANQREKTYKEQIKTLSAKLKQAEARA